MKRRTVIQRLSEWLRYWLPSLVAGLLLSAFDLRRFKPKKHSYLSVLVILIEHIGDVVVSTPLLNALRVVQPEARIVVVASTGAAALLEHSPYIDHFLVVKPVSGWWQQLIRTVEIARQLHMLDIDIAIVPKDAHNKDFNELICILAACRERVSRAHPQFSHRIKPLKFAPFYDHVIIDSKVRHEVEQRLEFARRLGYSGPPHHPEIWLTEEDCSYAETFFANILIASNAKIVAFGIGASAGGRRWPLESYAEVIERLGKNLQIVAILIVASTEINQAEELAQLTNYPVHFSTNATVRQSAALVNHGCLFIGNDSGPMHMAASMGLSVVEISSHPIGASPRSINSPERFGPYGVAHRILRPIAASPACKNGCVSTYAPHCIKQISPEAVLVAAQDLLNKKEVGTSNNSSG